MPQIPVFSECGGNIKIWGLDDIFAFASLSAHPEFLCWWLILFVCDCTLRCWKATLLAVLKPGMLDFPLAREDALLL